MKNYFRPTLQRVTALRNYRWFILASSVLALHSILAACSHGPWDIETYIQALERPDRVEYQKPEEVITALNLKEGMVIADIGAGTGYFTRRFAQAVGEKGKVLATDVEQKMLDYNRAQLAKLRIADNTDFILTKPGDPSLPNNTVDLIFLCNVYHHLKNPSAYVKKAKSALTATGRVVIIDFYHDERSGKLGFSKHHLVPREQVILHMELAGFRLSKEHTFLPRQYFLKFIPAH